jgi:hypothetical protein
MSHPTNNPQQEVAPCPRCQGTGEIDVNYYPPAGYGDATISCPFCGGTGVIPSKKAKSYILGSNLQTVATLFVIPLFCLLGFVISYLTDGSPITICYSIAIGVVLTILVAWFGASLQ